MALDGMAFQSAFWMLNAPLPVSRAIAPMRCDGGSQKRGQNGAEVVPIPVLTLSLLTGGFCSERTGAVKGAPLLGAA